MTAYRLSLPYPPTVNTYWRRVGNRTLISKAGRDYRKTVASLVMVQRMALRLDARLAVAISLFMPDRRRRDLDNVLKALLDALTHAGLWQDDEQIDVLMIKRDAVEPPGHVDVEVICKAKRAGPCQPTKHEGKAGAFFDSFETSKS